MIANMLLVYCYCLFYLLRTEAEPEVMLSPSGVVSICMGEQITFTCSTDRAFIEWNVTVLQSGVRSSRTRLVLPETRTPTPLRINTMTFNIARISPIGSLPLISTLVVANATSERLNGTEVNCTDIGNSLAHTSSSVAFVHIIPNEYPKSPEAERLNVVSFGSDSVAVFLQWADEDGVLYYVDVTPQVPFLVENISSIQLIVQYNVQYNVSILPFLCGQNGTATVIEINFIKCDEHPLHQISLIEILEFYHPAIAGTNVTISCPSGKDLLGPSTLTCMENGEWDPDPWDIECKANCGPPSFPTNGYILPYLSTLEGATVTIICQDQALQAMFEFEGNLTKSVCNHEGIWEPDPSDFCQVMTMTDATPITLIVVITLSSVTFVLLLSSIMFFIIGTLCGCKRKQATKKSSDEHTDAQNVLYEEVLPTGHCIELEQNIAYGPVRPQHTCI